MDPLSLLREFNVKNELDQVHTDGDRVLFGDRYSFAKSSLTAYQSQRGQGDFYTLETLLFFLQNKKLNAQEYIKQAREHNVPQVNYIDRKVLLEYLNGDIEASQVPHISVDALPLNIFTQVQASGQQLKRDRPPDDEGGPLKVLLSQERQLRNRNSMLLAPDRDFSKVLAILKSVEHTKVKHTPAAPTPGKHDHRHHGSHHSNPAASHHHHHSGAAPASGTHRHSSSSRPPDQARVGGAIPIKPSNRYDRDATTDHLRAFGGDAAAALGEVIDIYGTKSSKGASVSGGGATSQAGPGQKSGGGAGGGGTPQGSRPSGHSSGGSASKSGSGRSSGLPIIIVPAGLSSLLNMYNAPQFLEKGVFIASESARQGAAKLPQVTISVESVRDGTPTQYIVTDKAPDRKSSDWQRVVGVICQGAKWQFKDWPFKGAAKGDLFETFSKMAGFYLHYNDEKVPDVVSTWNVRYLALPRESRHQDITLRLEFFKHLEQFIAGRQPSYGGGH